jgi:hypothetical protein
MPSKIFKENLPDEYLFNFLNKIALKTENYYQIDINSYKKMIYNNYNEDFLTELHKYYNPTKYNYLEREFTYNSFTNILRQICKSKNIPYQSKIHYNKSKYGIIYLLYYNNII